MSILKLKPSCKDYLWGGHRLADEYGKEFDGDILAESWELSCHPDGPSTIINGRYAGKTLEQYTEEAGKDVLGTNCRRFRDFPILIKFIDAKENLSIQVHPDNRYALKNEGQYGKTEMWYVVDAEKDAFLYYGFKTEISKEEFSRRIREDTLLEVLNAVPLAKELGAYLPIPVEIANDADCAALGEAVAGAGKDCSDVVMLTLGTGVGGGIILDGDIYEGRGIGGSELGHMVIVENGEPCTCGRRGCLEAYASATALKRDACRASGKELTPEEIFALAEQGDAVMKAVVDAYIRRLGLGIVNIVNIFRPQLVLLGGGISRQGETLLAPLREIVKSECFGGEKGDVPEIEAAVLGNDAGMVGSAGLL